MDITKPCNHFHPAPSTSTLLKICRKFIGEHPCRSAISIKLLLNFIGITLWHGYSLVNLLPIFRRAFLKDTPGWLLLTLLHNGSSI